MSRQFDDLLQDLRYALRTLRQKPGFAAVAVLTLALGIGATTAIFSVLYAALIDPYPYPQADRIVRLELKDSSPEPQGMELNGLQVGQLQQSPVVESVLAMDFHAMSLTGNDYPENIIVISLISTGFNDLGVPALLGRGLLPSDSIDGREPNAVAVLSYKFWHTHFFGDPQIVGKKIELDHKPYMIVGVARPRFTWYSADVWLPLRVTKDDSRRFIIDIFLKPGMTNTAADSALQPLLEQFAHAAPKQFPERFKVQVEGLNEWVTRTISGTLYLLFGAVVLLLAIGCGNVSILLLARGAARQHELGVRTALGANRIRLVRQLLTESFLLSSLGAVLGVVLSFAILAGIKAVLPRYAFAPEVVVTLNRPVLMFSVAVALLTGVFSGLWPALRLSRGDVAPALQSGIRRIAGSVQGRRTHQALVSLQIALTLLLLAGAGAAMKGFLVTIHAPLGFDPYNVMSVPIPLRENSYNTWAARETYIEQLQKTIEQVPGVTMTGISNAATPTHSGWQTPVEIRGQVLKELPLLPMHMTSPGYFKVLRVRVQEGRLWSATEEHNCAPVAVVNRAFVKRYFPNGHAIGHAVRFPKLENRPPQELLDPQNGAGWFTIIGVIEDVRNNGLRDPVKPAVYVRSTLLLVQFTQILVKSAVPTKTLETPIRRQLAKFHPDQQTFSIDDLETWMADTPEWQQERLTTWVFGAFAALAVLLAAIGLYSVVSYAVVQRTGEFGIRMALGAQSSDILRSVFVANAASISGGILVGLILSLALNRFVERWAGGSSRDPLTLIAVLALLCCVSFVACAIPARYATAIDPMSALRFS